MSQKKILAFLIAVTMVIGLFSVSAVAIQDGTTTASSTKTFMDVPATHWAYEAITWMASQGILNGVGDGTFHPDDAVTREQFARIMVAALQLPVSGSHVQSFSDVPPGSWSFKYVEAAKTYLTGWDVVGRDLDLFLPQQPAVREDMAVALVKALGLQNEAADLSVLEAFSDDSTSTGGISPNLVPFVAIAVKNNLLTGAARDGGLYFDAQKTLTRAQASVLVFRSLAVAGEKVTYDDLPKVTYSDNTGDNVGSESCADTDDESCEEDTPAAPLPSATISANPVPGGIKLSWTKITDTRFRGYKVVLSKSDRDPRYPEDGYLTYITNPAENFVTITADSGYNGSSDFNGDFLSGQTYYARITTLFPDGKTHGNIIQIKIP